MENARASSSIGPNSRIGITNPNRRTFWQKLWDQKALLIMVAPFVAYVILFNYAPLWGWSMAFQKYKPAASFAQQQWVGFDQFKFLFGDDTFLRVLRNTLAMSLLNLVTGLITAVGFALLLNELKNMAFKRVVQTISYLPHFLSWIIVASLVSNILSIRADGILNDLLMRLHIIDKPILWLGENKYFWSVVTGANIWKSMGWNSIIYLAAISGIDPALYESADIDGAGRFRKIQHITLPGIASTIIVILIMNIGWVLNASFEIPYLLGNIGAVKQVSETIDIFVLRYGMDIGNYSLATAAGMFKSVISLILIMGANWLSARMGQSKLI